MQQELIEMLEKVVDHVVFCNGYDQRFSSTSYGVNILQDAKKLIEKAKNGAKETAVPQGEPVAQVSDLFPSIRTKLCEMGFEPESPLYTASPEEPTTPPYHRDLWGISHAIARINEAEYVSTFMLDQEPVTLTDEPPQKFVEWLERGMPPETVILIASWWAPRIYGAIIAALRIEQEANARLIAAGLS